MAYDHEQALADGRACLEAALYYRARGWSVVALCPPDHAGVGKGHAHQCKNKGKAPLVRWSDLQEHLASADDIRRWWQQWPNANVGIIMGRASGLVGVDIDNSTGLALFHRLAGGRLVPTLEFSTPGGGLRYLFEISGSDDLRIAYEAFGKHDEFRVLAEGSQTVAPPSRHELGGYYQWRQNPSITTR